MRSRRSVTAPDSLRRPTPTPPASPASATTGAYPDGTPTSTISSPSPAPTWSICAPRRATEDVLADPARYAAAAALPAATPGRSPDAPDSPTARAARRRRDLAVEGYLTLRARVLAEGPQALRPLHESAARLVAPQASGWLALWQQGAATQSSRTGVELDRLAERADAAHLSHGTLHAAPRTAGPRRYGMYGRLETWDLGSALTYPLPLT
ncbi:hypothetical protein P8605_01495 [Streptomyces sp. T-3]|nr:hypothetical protein [Streptomyces sp. T-3]